MTSTKRGEILLNEVWTLVYIRFTRCKGLHKGVNLSKAYVLFGSDLRNVCDIKVFS